MDIFVGRQPILNTARSVVGYELLFRSGEVNAYTPGMDGRKATLTVLGNTAFHFGLDALVGEHRAFINFTQDLLLEEFNELLPPERVVIEVLETVVLDAPVQAACQRLRERGYRLALDDVTEAARVLPLLDCLAYVKVDWLAADAASRQGIVRLCRSRPGMTLIAEKIETEDDFRQAAAEGFHLFQGYFFSRPEVARAQAPSIAMLAHLDLLKETARPDSDMMHAVKIIEREPALAVTLLKYLNSAVFMLRQEITSIRHALLLLGQRNLRRWVVTLLATQACQENQALLLQSVERARFMEACADLFHLQGHEEELFLTGLLSLGERMLMQTMEELVRALGLSKNIANTLLGGQSPFVPVFRCVMSFERGDWESVQEVAREHGLEHDVLAWRYRDAVRWSRKLLD